MNKRRHAASGVLVDLVSAVRTTVERGYTDVWVEGEISNFRPSESGHLYFTMKDGDAQLSIVMFRSQARLLRFRPESRHAGDCPGTRYDL